MISARSHRLALALASSLFPFAVRADTLYEQPFATTANGGYFASVPAGYLQYDSFVLPAGGAVSSVGWYGVDLNELINVNPINPTSFAVNFYADQAGLPGALVSSSTIGNSANATNTGQQLMGLTLYSFSGALATPLSLTAGTKYWLQITDPTTNADWFWASGAGNDGTHYTNVGSGAAGTGLQPDDMSFRLTGTAPVPEPASMTMLALGALGLVRRGRRRA